MTDMKKAKACAVRLTGLAEPTRIRIVDCLSSGPKNVTEIAKALKIEIVNASHHLGVMREAKLVRDEKQGRFVIYSLTADFTPKKGRGSAIDFGWCKVDIAAGK